MVELHSVRLMARFRHTGRQSDPDQQNFSGSETADLVVKAINYAAALASQDADKTHRVARNRGGLRLASRRPGENAVTRAHHLRVMTPKGSVR